MNQTLSEQMLAFIDKNPTAFHTTSALRDILLSRGYEELTESSRWNLKTGGSYFVCRNGSSLLAFQIGRDVNEDYSFSIAASHTDSPSFKLKELSQLENKDHYSRLNTEGYGGMICSTWMDRPLSIAGRVLVKEGEGKIVSRLVNIDRDLLLIPNPAIHMNRDVNEGTSFNKQIDMLPVCGEDLEKGAVNELIAKELNVAADSILGADLYLYPRVPGTVWGLQNEFISGSRLDDQQCTYCILQGLLAGGHARSVSVAAFFDNEEVGSGTKQGAASTFLSDVLSRINRDLGFDETQYHRALASSFMLSADNAHAVHPNHPEMTDQNNHVYMNRGVVVKSHASQKYTSDGMSIALIREIASRAGVPLQYFANRSDKQGGSTLGNIAMSQVSVAAVDIGLAQLAMHSSYETAGVRDTAYMIALISTFFGSHFQEGGFGIMEITD